MSGLEPASAPLANTPSRARMLLESIGSGGRHSGGSLVAHLVGTYELLAAWGCSQPVCDAGLLHSIRGTEAYPAALQILTRASLITLAIDPRARVLVEVFSTMSLASFTSCLERANEDPRIIARHDGLPDHRLSLSLFRDLCHVAAANLLEQSPRLPTSRQGALTEQLTRLKPFVDLPAVAAIAARCSS